MLKPAEKVARKVFFKVIKTKKLRVFLPSVFSADKPLKSGFLQIFKRFEISVNFFCTSIDFFKEN
jgi:hypothetical protein